MKKSFLIIALLLGTSIGANAQSSDKSLLIDETGQQFEISNAVIFMGEDLHINSQGKVTRANGEVVGYATQIGPNINNNDGIMYDNTIPTLIPNLGGASGLKEITKAA